MGRPGQGKHKCHRVGDAIFVAALGDNTSLTLSLDGRINGTFVGHEIKGHGSVSYTYAECSDKWLRSEYEGAFSAVPPAEIPVTVADLVKSVYDPKGRCRGKVSIETSGDVEEGTTNFRFREKRLMWKMRNRVEQLCIIINQDCGGGNVCDLTFLDDSPDICAEDCTTANANIGDEACAEECQAILDGEC